MKHRGNKKEKCLGAKDVFFFSLRWGPQSYVLFKYGVVSGGIKANFVIYWLESCGTKKTKKGLPQAS